MSLLTVDFLESIFKKEKETSLFGKWIRFNDINALLKKHEGVFKVSQIGTSEQERPIYQLKIGTGKKKILLWSQMHGNESTGTKALFDLFNCFLNSSANEITSILKECTLVFIPMLNPDGAEVYTRVNSNKIDLNRDAVDRKAKESQLLRSVLEAFHPQFCFNLHDQRTIFNVENTKNPATISFLAPSEEETRALTAGRKATMNVIIAMSKVLQKVIPNCIGRYTDEFYPRATGDNFQKLGYNTILIESGHYPEDYVREVSRKYTFFAIFQGLFYIAKTTDFSSYKEYFNIPNNDKVFYDVIHRFPTSKNDVAYQYQDEIIDDVLVSKLIKIEERSLKGKFGHNEIVFVGDLY
ncbi:M14 family zinc carboxypeptidase [uncultured Polaribacter sp.]|uniref:M14 family zinc carboxypeptidase n=1 Tax=uncultured Polaribacter sp. TaxID=174711 RepID=UPI00261BF32C|nr:M14 family zinc carboxypeptidase [uncultured Polaribacter sp.]